mmetsp:Transcript_13529/g.47749  ORF Transcript_13529/g.47749 Transcript_13529/m.47749 type:complete len:284 (+) Transcript_13529:5509-6360(+)
MASIVECSFAEPGAPGAGAKFHALSGSGTGTIAGGQRKATRPLRMTRRPSATSPARQRRSPLGTDKSSIGWQTWPSTSSLTPLKQSTLPLRCRERALSSSLPRSQGLVLRSAFRALSRKASHSRSRAAAPSSMDRGIRNTSAPVWLRATRANSGSSSTRCLGNLERDSRSGRTCAPGAMTICGMMPWAPTRAMWASPASSKPPTSGPPALATAPSYADSPSGSRRSSASPASSLEATRVCAARSRARGASGSKASAKAGTEESSMASLRVSSVVRAPGPVGAL